MLDNSPFKRAINEQVKNDNCAICQEPLSDTEESPASFSFRTLVYASNCEQPHFMHTKCALNLVEHTSGTNLPCPVCRRRIGEIEPSRLFLQSLKNKEDQLNKCKQFEGRLRAILDQVRTSGLPDSRLPELINLTKEAQAISEKTEELTSCLRDAHWLLGKTFFERAQKNHVLMDMSDAIIHFKYCMKMSGEENKGEIQDYMQKTNQLRLDNFLDSARNNARFADDKLKLLEEDEFNPDELSPAVKQKYGELFFIRAKERHTTANRPKKEIKKDLRTAINYGFAEPAPWLAKIYLNSARKKLKEEYWFAFVYSPKKVIDKIEFSITNGFPKTKQQAENLKIKLSEKFLELVQEAIKSARLNESDIKHAFEALEFAALSGTNKVKADAEALLQKKQELIRDNQNIPEKKLPIIED